MTTTFPGHFLDILVCGFAIHRIDPQRPYGTLRGNATRAFGLANNLARQGWRTGLVVEPGCVCPPSPFVSSNLRLVNRTELAAAAMRARVLLLACTNLSTLAQNVPEAVGLNHPRTWVASCFDQNRDFDPSVLAPFLVGVSFNNEQQADSWRQRGIPSPVHVVPYGVDEHAYLDEAIVPAERPTAIWVGALRHPVLLQRIVRFAEVNPECEVQVVSGLVFDQQLPQGVQGSFSNPYIDEQRGPAALGQFAGVVEEWCHRSVPENLRYLGQRPGENAQLLGAATVALGFSRRAGQLHDDSKILDYLRSGVPVLCDDGQPSHRFILESGHGFVMPFAGGDEALREGYQKCLSLADTHHRRAIAAWTRDTYGWPAVANKVATWIEADVNEAASAAARRLQAACAAWPELARWATTLYYEPAALDTPRFERHHVMETVERARRREPRSSVFYLTDTAIDLQEPGVVRVYHPAEATAVPGPKVFVCAFDSDEKLATVLAQIQAIPDSVYLMPRLFLPTARYFHRNDAAWAVLRSEAALAEPKFSLADFENVIQALESTRDVPGDFVEVGVYRGRSAHCALAYMERAGLRRRAWLLDVFEGFTYPLARSSRDGYWAGSQTDASEADVRAWLEAFPNAKVVKHNIISDPLPPELLTVAVANIDVDLHEAVSAALERLAPLTVPGSILILEDQGHTPPLGGAWLAVQQFLNSPAAADFTPIHMASGQMFLVRHRPAGLGATHVEPGTTPSPSVRTSRPDGLRLLYVPWIDGHTGALVRLLDVLGIAEFVPLPLTDLLPRGTPPHRSQVMRLAQDEPEEFLRRLRELVSRMPGDANALLLTVDWCAGLRHTAQAFREHGFPTVLVPHESVFAQEEAYYRDPVTGTNVPQTDVALLWGGLQEQIFTGRGVGRDRLRVLGSPKLDAVRAYQSPFDRDLFYSRFKLQGNRPTCLFATQPLDNQFESGALLAQSQAIEDVLACCERNEWQLVVRLPPARGAEILEPEVVTSLTNSRLAAVDGIEEGRSATSPLDALSHADVVISINSTMLLEASLMGRPALSIGYVSSDQLWHTKGGLPLVTTSRALEAALRNALAAGTSLLSPEGEQWIRWAFSPGAFDGLSARRILECIHARWPARRPIRSAVGG